ncbi:MAG: hypothetical protein FWF30_01515 [Coriobacteriia bacterium]|nr:hypothetical protein [Coriobacteriia bacterium]
MSGSQAGCVRLRKILFLGLGLALAALVLWLGAPKTAYADDTVSIGMQGGAGYTFKFYFQDPGNNIVPAADIEDGFYVVSLDCGAGAGGTGGGGAAGSLSSVATLLPGQGSLQRIEVYRDSDGYCVATVAPGAIALGGGSAGGGTQPGSSAALITLDDGPSGLQSDGTLAVLAGSADFSFDLLNASCSLGLKASQEVDGATADSVAGMFDFAVYDAGQHVLATASNAADGSIGFSEINYTEADLGLRTYTLSEAGNTLPALEQGLWTVVRPDYPVDVAVAFVDNTLVATPLYTDGVPPVFVNVYRDGSAGAGTGAGAGTIRLAAQVQTIGRDLEAGLFTFAVVDPLGNIVSTAKNDGYGNVTFPEISFSTDDLGTHQYTVTEINTHALGWTFDHTAYAVTINVGLDDSGALAVTAKYTRDLLPLFTNSYKLPTLLGASVALAAKNIVVGTDQDTAGWFDFAVADESGRVVATGTNDSAGHIVFADIAYLTEADLGTHLYTVRETSLDGNGWEVDKGVYDVLVFVDYVDLDESLYTQSDADQADAQLVASIELISQNDSPVEQMAFTNVYSSSAVESGSRDDTGSGAVSAGGGSGGAGGGSGAGGTAGTGDAAFLLIIVAGLLVLTGAVTVVTAVWLHRHKPGPPKPDQPKPGPSTDDRPKPGPPTDDRPKDGPSTGGQR